MKLKKSALCELPIGKKAVICSLPENDELRLALSEKEQLLLGKIGIHARYGGFDGSSHIPAVLYRFLIGIVQAPKENSAQGKEREKPCR